MKLPISCLSTGMYTCFFFLLWNDVQMKKKKKKKKNQSRVVLFAK